MELSSALIVFLIVTIALIIVFIRCRIFLFSSITLGLLIGWILLNLACPPTCVSPFSESNSVTALYFLIELSVPVLILVYVFIKALSDRKNSYTSTSNSLLNVTM